MANHLGLKIESSEDSFTFVDYSTRNVRTEFHTVDFCNPRKVKKL